MAEDDARAVLDEGWPGEIWTLARPNQGWRKECWVARSAARAVFVAFDLSPAPLMRLGELGVAPRVLRHGGTGGRSWVVQEWIEGQSPTREWLRCHAGRVGELFGLVHTDAPLSQLLDGRGEMSGKATLDAEVAHLNARLDARSESWFRGAEVRSGLADFFAQAPALEPGPLVPTHDEPNTSNMLVRGNRLWLLDWDDIVLADAFRDAGPLLWWYFPERDWEAVLRPMGLPLDAGCRAKIHWYAARISLSVALWHAEQGHADDRGFLGDFLSAVKGQPNPRGAS